MVATLDEVVTALTTLHDDLSTVISQLSTIVTATTATSERVQLGAAANLFGTYIAMLTNGVAVPDGFVTFLEAQLGFTMPTTALGVSDLLVSLALLHVDEVELLTRYPVPVPIHYP